ncbi:MAG: alpha/beta hydrolase-fold protein [Bacteroidales bacterium]|nr:alpha/beta hydrolase-fold protein [Bacteroidales bacterium]MDD3891621.1 alpha/beta hydrolase-fold protein [Bacteroidales bacterium]
MRNLALTFILLTLSIFASAQVTFIIKSLPEDTPKGSSFFMAGTNNKWIPNEQDQEFKYDNMGRLSLTLYSVPDTLEYKICRGNWTAVEVDSTGEDIPNRIYADSLGKTIVLNIHHWRDRLLPKQLVSTASSNVFFTPTSIEIPQLNRRRTVRVYFPPNYSSSQGFPVIYMFDGQNAFDKSTAFSNEWRIDETLDSLHHTRAFGAIVVAIYHGEDERINEYTPWPNQEKIGGDGPKMAKFIVKNLKPYIDKHYRTLPDADNTMIIGSSLGGLMALYTALEYPSVFSKVGVFSPSLWWSDEIFKQIEKHKKKNYQKIYLLAGGQEDNKMASNLKKAKRMLKETGFSDDNELMLKICEDGRHSEWFWAREFPHAVRWLFGF